MSPRPLVAAGAAAGLTWAAALRGWMVHMAAPRRSTDNVSARVRLQQGRSAEARRLAGHRNHHHHEH
jgi:hypothetical protein